MLDAGITVISTVNVQHLESLNDVVTQITGIEQQEKVPDEVVRAADQIELVDITPEALRRRLAHGNVYAPERVDAALSNYFRAGNLTALRELALLWLADQVDAALREIPRREQDHRHLGGARTCRRRGDRRAESETLVRRASRIASRSSAELMVVHVVRGDGLRVSPRRRWARCASWPPASAPPCTPSSATTCQARCWIRPRRERHPAGDRHVAAVAVGAHLRRGHRRVGGAAVREDRRAHGDPRPRRQAGSSWSRTRRGNGTWPLGLPLCGSVGHLRADRRCARPVSRSRRRERAVLHRRAHRRAARRRRPCRAVGRAVRLLLNYFLVEPRYTFTIAEPDSAVTIVVLLAGRRRRRRARRRGGAAAPAKPGARRRRPNCSHCSPVRCCAAPTSTRCWSGSAKPTRNAPSACCGRPTTIRRRDRRVRRRRPLRRRRHRRHRRSRSATTSSGC